VSEKLFYSGLNFVANPALRGMPPLHTRKIRGTDSYCRWYTAEDERLYNLVGDVQVGDLIVCSPVSRTAVPGRGGVERVKVKTGARYPGNSLPRHTLRLRPGKNPMWVRKKRRREEAE